MKEYFSHDYNARNDKKLIKLFMKHGVSGIGIYWCIVEMLFEESGYLSIDEYERISFELRTENDTIKSVIENFELFENDGEKFWSESALDRLKLRIEKSEKARKSVEKRWEKHKRNTNVEQTNNERNTSKVKESKENETKINKEVFSFSKSLQSLGVEKQIIEDWLKVRKQKRAVNSETAFKAIEKQIKLSGLTANECITISVENSWSGFKLEWINKNETNKPNKDGFDNSRFRKPDGSIV